jgi:hypothetical protein
MGRRDGYRYVRQYWRGADRSNYALWEVRGGLARRVGTARHYEEAAAFLGVPQQQQQEGDGDAVA